MVLPMNRYQLSLSDTDMNKSRNDALALSSEMKMALSFGTRASKCPHFRINMLGKVEDRFSL